MQIDLSRESERVSVVAPRGRLDLASAPTLRERLRQLIGSGTPRLVVDLGDVTFVDSSGLGAVIGGLKAARQAGGDLRIARPNQQVQLVLNRYQRDSKITPEVIADTVGLPVTHTLSNDFASAIEEQKGAVARFPGRPGTEAEWTSERLPGRSVPGRPVRAPCWTEPLTTSPVMSMANSI